MPRPRAAAAFLAALPILCLLKALQCLPLDTARRIARATGRLALVLLPRLHRIAAENLERAFPGMPAHEKRRIAVRAMDSLCTTAAELVKMRAFSRNQFGGAVEIEGWHHVDETRGALFIGGHVANWEIVSIYFSGLGYPVGVIYRAHQNPWIDRAINALRIGTGTEIIEKEDAAKRALPLLQRGGFIGLLIDQAPRENAVPVTWFGHDCWATAGPALLAQRARVPVHFVTIRRRENGSYLLSFNPPLPLERTGRLIDDLRINSQIMQEALEKDVREQPDQWLWFHKRWKQRPRLEEEWARRQKRQRPAVQEAHDNENT